MGGWGERARSRCYFLLATPGVHKRASLTEVSLCSMFAMWLVYLPYFNPYRPHFLALLPDKPYSCVMALNRTSGRRIVLTGLLLIVGCCLQTRAQAPFPGLPHPPARYTGQSIWDLPNVPEGKVDFLACGHSLSATSSIARSMSGPSELLFRAIGSSGTWRWFVRPGHAETN
jgi:hypothetical protein